LKTILKYLETFSEKEIPRGLYRQTFFPKKTNVYFHCAVIPLYGESLWCELGLPSLLQAAEKVNKKTLLIAVINRHELSNEEIRKQNEKTLSYFESFPKTFFPDSSLIKLYELSTEVDVLVLNHNDEPNLFSSKEGVGRARKLGCDMALALSTTPLLSIRYIHTTDGDAVVDEDYFEIEKTSQTDVLLHPYTHIGDYEQMAALKLYEQSLRYYVAGLKYANSPYAHESLGSTIAITPECYAAVRGFPKRNAAEDFYLLNKAVKVGTLEQANQGLVKLIGRISDRVPFGTGVGTEKIWQKMKENRPITFYHPQTFVLVKNLISVLESWSQTSDSLPDRKQLTQSIQGDAPLANFERLEPLLDSLGFFRILETAKQQRTNPQAILKHLHESWDGFKTLKFIHGIRDHFLPEVSTLPASYQYFSTAGHLNVV